MRGGTIFQKNGEKLIHQLHNATDSSMGTPRPVYAVGSGDLTHLFIVGVTPHDSRVHNAVEQHGERVHGEGPVPGVLLHTVADPLIGELHGLDGILQGADLLL